MQQFYEPLVQPLIEILDAQVILEVGDDRGVDAALLGASCAAEGRTLLNLEPADVGEPGQWLENLSTQRWPAMDRVVDPVDLALIGGQGGANALGVELDQLRQRCDRLGHAFPVVVVHDGPGSFSNLSATVSSFCRSTQRELGFALVSGARQVAVLFEEQRRRESSTLAEFLDNLQRVIPKVERTETDHASSGRQTSTLRRRFEYLQAAAKLALLEYEDSLEAAGQLVEREAASLPLQQVVAERDAWRSYALALRAGAQPPELPRLTAHAAPALVPELPEDSKPLTVDASPKPQQAAAVDVVVCICDALEHVQLCLQSLLAHRQLDERIVLVDDGSSAETGAFLEQWCSEHELYTELIRHETNRGYTAAVNSGLEVCSAPYVVLLNSDTQVTEGWLKKMVRCAQSDDKIGIVGPLSNAASWQSVPRLLNGEGRFAINDVPAGYSLEQFAQLVEDTSLLARPQVPFVNGFCFLMTREVLASVGPFDTESFPWGYGEENDFCLRASAAGYRLAIADDTFVYHAKSQSFGAARREQLAKDGHRALVKKHGAELVQRSVEQIRTEPQLLGVRQRLDNAVVPLDGGPSDHDTTPSKESPKAAAVVGNEEKNSLGTQAPAAGTGEAPLEVPLAESIVFLLPVAGGGGGAHSVVQEAAAMRRAGASARVAVRAAHLSGYNAQYPEFAEGNSLFEAVAGDHWEDLGAEHSIAIATIYTSVPLLERICNSYSHITPAYYIQDYEPLFFAAKSKEYKRAVASYTLVPQAVLFAKTWWLVDMVGKTHDLYVHKVRPSLDHGIFRPVHREATNVVTIAAMIRPSTPRRGAARTMDVLARLQRQCGAAVRIVVFGCAPNDSEYLALARNADWENRGLLKRREVAELLATTDVFVDLSDYQAFGRTGLEAMACGCAVVNPCKGGTDEYCVHEDNCLLVDTSNSQECYEALLRLVKSPELRQRLSSRAIRTAQGYTTDGAAQSELVLLNQEASKYRRTTGNTQWTAEGRAARLAVLTEVRAARKQAASATATQSISTLERKLRKLVRDPKKFAADSNNSLVRRLGSKSIVSDLERGRSDDSEKAAKQTPMALAKIPPSDAAESLGGAGRTKRKFVKLLRDPRKFLADSSLPMAKRVAKSNLLWK